MSVRRVMGTETEYAVSAPGQGRYNPVQLSFDVVGAASDASRSHIRWDYRQEDPVNDARGTRLERAAAHPDLLTDAPQLNITNVIAPNGGRIYVDHAHPEYSAPETTDPLRSGAIRPCRRSHHARRRSQGKRDDGTENRAAPQQRRRQRSQLGHARKLHDAAVGTVRPGDTPHDHALRLPTDLHRLRPRRHRRT